MIETKLLEIRDRGTFIPALAMRVTTERGEPKDYLLRRAGYGPDGCVILVHLQNGRASNDAYNWNGCRTMTTAHDYLERWWFTVASGDVIDVQFIKGETTSPVQSESVEPFGAIP